jgi:glycosyltransferase involved in cell wall biosynthesis
MKIGILGPIWFNIPPKKYGGTEEVVYNLVEGLVKKGHEVTLFGPKTSKVSSKVNATVDKPLKHKRVAWQNIPYNLYHISEFFDKAHEFDILHVHLNTLPDFMALPLIKRSKTPVITTLHFKLPSHKYQKDALRTLERYKDLPFTSISKSQRRGSKLNFVKTVYNSIRMEEFKFNEKGGDYLVWLGKVNHNKGTKDAIIAAKKAGEKLILMGAVERGVKEWSDYYDKEVKPLIDGKQIIWLGEVGMRQKSKVLGKAKAFLNPINWAEPFGLVMIESQAKGTPVISFARGAATELIVNGKTGYLVKNIDQMVEKIKIVHKLKRTDARKNVEKKFSVERMVDDYEKVYKSTIKSWDKVKNLNKAP